MPLILKTFIFTILFPGAVTLWIPYLLKFCPQSFFLEFGPFRFAGIGLIISGASIYILCAWDFAFKGKGTPASQMLSPLKNVIGEEPEFLVQQRLYTLVRNPMYVGMIFILIGETIFFESMTFLIYTISVWTMFHLFVIFNEEPHLEKKYGASYKIYCSVVPRWIPKF